MKVTSSFSSLVLAAGVFGVPASGATLITFDTDGEFAANFTPEIGATESISQPAGNTVGINSTGGLATANGNGNSAFAYFSAASGDATAGNTITASIDFQVDFRSGGSGAFELVTLGIATDFTGNASGVSVQLLGNSATLNDIQLNFGGGVVSSAFTPTEGAWYRFNYATEDNGTNVIRTGSIDLLNNDGTVNTASLISGSRSLASGTETDTEFVGLRAFDSFGGGSLALDNFNTSIVIPEPGSLGLATLGVLAMCTRRRPK